MISYYSCVFFLFQAFLSMKVVKPKVTVVTRNRHTNRANRRRISVAQHLQCRPTSNKDINVQRQVTDIPAEIHFGCNEHTVTNAPATAEMYVESACVSQYQQYRDRTIAQWSTIRDDILKVHVERIVPQSLKCISCGEVGSSVVRCNTCGPFYLVCKQCCLATHRFKPYHILDEWTVCIATTV